MGYHTLLALAALCNSEKLALQWFCMHHIYFFAPAYNSRVLQQWSTKIENTHIKACVHHEGRMPYTAWSDKHLQVLFK